MLQRLFSASLLLLLLAGVVRAQSLADGQEAYALTIHVLVATEAPQFAQTRQNDWAKANISYKVSDFRMRWM